MNYLPKTSTRNIKLHLRSFLGTLASKRKVAEMGVGHEPVCHSRFDLRIYSPWGLLIACEMAKDCESPASSSRERGVRRNESRRA